MKHLNKILIALLVILVLLYLRQCNEALSIEDTNTLLNEEIERIRDARGVESAKKQSVIAENKKNLKELKQSKAVIKELRENLSKKSRAGFVAKTTTTREVVTVTDTVYNEVSEFPTYESHFHDKWISYHITASKDSVKLKLDSLNNVSAGVFDDRNPIIGKRKIEFNLKSYNPHTTTTDMQSFIYQPKPKRIGVGVMAGYGISGNGLSPFLGVGVSYNLFSF